MQQVASATPGSIAYPQDPSAPSVAPRSNASLESAAVLSTSADHSTDPSSHPLKGVPVPVPVDTITAATAQDSESPDAPPKTPLYKRRWFIIVNVIANCIGIALLFIMLFPVVKAIVQDIVNKTTLQITTVAITNPTNNSFQLLLQGTVDHTGPFPAVIWFPTPLNVSWLDESTKVPLGYMQLSTLHVSKQTGSLNDSTTFYITDEDAWGRFMAAMLTSQNFTWQLENYNLKVQAEKFPTAYGVSFNKLVTVNGINNFAGNVQVEHLQLPSDNPSSGMNFSTVLQLYNPSPFTLDLGTTVFNLSYQGLYLGNGTGSNTELSPGNNNVTLDVVFVPQTSSSSIATVSQLLTNSLDNQTSPVLATGNSTIQSDGTAISWLSQGFESLSMTIPF